MARSALNLISGAAGSDIRCLSNIYEVLVKVLVTWKVLVTSMISLVKKKIEIPSLLKNNLQEVLKNSLRCLMIFLICFMVPKRIDPLTRHLFAVSGFFFKNPSQKIEFGQPAGLETP
jgi:hypothetical protein